MQTDLDVVASHLRNWQWMLQSGCSTTEIHKYEEKDLHLHDHKNQEFCKHISFKDIRGHLEYHKLLMLNFNIVEHED